MGKVLRTSLSANQVKARRQAIGRFLIEVVHYLAQPAADSISNHRRPHLSRYCVRHLGRAERGVGQKPDPEQLVVRANTIGTQPSERCTSSKPIDQADSLLRPRRRRALMIARPLLVIIRCRNPWRRARRCTFGWYVRFTTSSKAGVPSARGRLTSASRLPAYPLRYGFPRHHDNQLT